MKKKTKVVIAQLGSPKTPSVKDVRSYLREFLGDPRVVDINPLVWKIILNCFVLPFRPKKSAAAYSRIWDGDGFPLVKITHEFVAKLKTHFDASEIEIDACFLLTKPRPIDVFSTWAQEDELNRAEKVLLLPQFPQYSESTIASVFDSVAKDALGLVNLPDINFITSFHLSKAFIENYALNINKTLELHPADELVISFHGIPLRRVTVKRDLYYSQCFETFYLLKERIKSVDPKNIHFCFQSRFGSEQWLGPSTDEYTENLAKNGAKQIVIACPSFTVDCLETTDEIGNELQEEVDEYGTKVYSVPCLNAEDKWVADYAHFIKTQIKGTEKEKEDLDVEIDRQKVRELLPRQIEKSPALDESSKKVLKIVFLAVFLDLVGFSIIFPLFPQMAKYYLEVDADNFFLKSIWESIDFITSSGGEIQFRPVVLFGGMLGALYSLLQFVAAPLWGRLSDKIGRKPVMLFTVAGLSFSYGLWFFAGSFTILILGRILGGLMGGNLSTATAIVSDITDEKRRSKGMAFIGIAFAFGFIFGPAIGGLLSLIDLTEIFPVLKNYGVNPFSLAALFAAVLSLINLWMIKKGLPETLQIGSDDRIKRTSNIFKLLAPFQNRELNLTNLAYGLFISAFSGMEFTLTFLALERLGFSSLDNGLMFIFIGLVIALVQGGYVRRKAALIGERKLVIRGLITIIPGLLIISYASNTFFLYLGLFFLSVGSSLVIPCITSLVSFYAPKSEQGKALGTFRSIGSLGRVLGPIFASLVYWKYGSSVPYLVGSLALLVPIFLVGKLPKSAT
jgi:ferrochelatase